MPVIRAPVHVSYRRPLAHSGQPVHAVRPAGCLCVRVLLTSGIPAFTMYMYVHVPAHVRAENLRDHGGVWTVHLCSFETQSAWVGNVYQGRARQLIMIREPLQSAAARSSRRNVKEKRGNWLDSGLGMLLSG